MREGFMKSAHKPLRSHVTLSKLLPFCLSPWSIVASERFDFRAIIGYHRHILLIRILFDIKAAFQRRECAAELFHTGNAAGSGAGTGIDLHPAHKRRGAGIKPAGNVTMLLPSYFREFSSPSLHLGPQRAQTALPKSDYIACSDLQADPKESYSGCLQ